MLMQSQCKRSPIVTKLPNDIDALLGLDWFNLTKASVHPAENKITFQKSIESRYKKTKNKVMSIPILLMILIYKMAMFRTTTAQRLAGPFKLSFYAIHQTGS